jgi:hypothetical protein
VSITLHFAVQVIPPSSLEFEKVHAKKESSEMKKKILTPDAKSACQRRLNRSAAKQTAL